MHHPSQETRLSDGAGQRPAYNLRTLSRALSYCRAMAPTYGLQRALYDGAAMAFATQLAPEAEAAMEALLRKHLLPGVKNVKVGAFGAQGEEGGGGVQG